MRSSEFITELFDTDKAYPIHDWNYEEDSQGYTAAATDSSGTPIEIMFTPLHDSINAIDFDFSKGGSFDQTGEGDAGKIFATVINALDIYLKHLNKPDYILFGSKGESRTRLYQSMIRRFAPRFGYKQIPYSSLPGEITDQPTPEGEMLVLAKQSIDTAGGRDKLTK